MTPDFLWKIIACGQGGVGKTTFLLRYLTDKFVSNTALTVGVQLHTHNLERQGKKIGLVLWDLGGQDRFRFIQPTYVKGAVASLVFFDASRSFTLFEIREWVDLIRKNALPNSPILLVGTKIDIVDQEDIEDTIKEAWDYVKELDLSGLVMTSSKTGENIHEAIATLVDTLLMQNASKPAVGITSSTN